MSCRNGDRTCLNSSEVNIMVPYGCCYKLKWSHILGGALRGEEDGRGHLKLRSAGEGQGKASVAVTAIGVVLVTVVYAPVTCQRVKSVL